MGLDFPKVHPPEVKSSLLALSRPPRSGALGPAPTFGATSLACHWQFMPAHWLPSGVAPPPGEVFAATQTGASGLHWPGPWGSMMISRGQGNSWMDTHSASSKECPPPVFCPQVPTPTCTRWMPAKRTILLASGRPPYGDEVGKCYQRTEWREGHRAP